MEELLIDYKIQFGEFPPQLIMIPYEDEVYASYIKKAVERNRKLTPQEIEEIAEAKPYDIVD